MVRNMRLGWGVSLPLQCVEDVLLLWDAARVPERHAGNGGLMHTAHAETSDCAASPGG